MVLRGQWSKEYIGNNLPIIGGIDWDNTVAALEFSKGRFFSH
jgi:hypothetical protein